MKLSFRIVTLAACLSVLLLTAADGLAAAAADPPEAGETASPPASPKARFEVTDRYTAQRRPRVAVFRFNNTNTGAQDTRYGAAVEAMLVTFLKRKSQFVVVERQRLKDLLTEKEMLQIGMVQLNPDDTDSQTLLEKIDVFVLGSVTLLDTPAFVRQQPTKKDAVEIAVDVDAGGGGEPKDEEEAEIEEESGPEPAAGEDSWETGEDPWATGEVPEDGTERARAEKREAIQGARIEIDVKLISRFDGRIIAAAQRSGPLACLRSIVERLGIALEQEFLRPYYGKLKVTLEEPDHIRVFLTPILPERALDEEKPPTEIGSTVTISGDHDIVEPWTTDPTTYTIRNVLSGWYSMRIERPGYSEIGTENSRWEVRTRLGKQIVYDRVSNRPLDQLDFKDRRFIVRVDPLTTEVIDGDALKFTFRKERGSIAPLVKRQYRDGDFKHKPSRVLLIGGEEIEINRLDRPDEYADDPRCDLFREHKPLLANYGRTHVAPGQSFDFDQFTGGELIIEDYQGEPVPVGVYKMVVWEPSYRTERSKVRVRDRDEAKTVKTPLTRDTSTLILEATGPRPTHRVIIEGIETRYQKAFFLDFETPLELRGMPADRYVTKTNIDDLDGWERTASALSANVTPPAYDPNSKRDKPRLLEAPPPKTEPVWRVPVKTRFGLAGRLEALSRRPDPVAADLFIDQDFLKILNLLLYGATERPAVERMDFWKAAAEVGRVVAPLVEANARDDVPLRLGNATLQALLWNGAPERSSREARPEGSDGLGARPPVKDPFPRDPDVLRKLLAARLELLDLVVLDPVDMEQLRRSPEVSAILARYVASGGSIFAYVSSVGDYRQVISTPLNVESLSKRTRRLNLAPGEVEGLIPRFDRKDVKVKAKRALPEVADLPSSWRTLAYTREGRRPRIVEAGGREDGAGYVVLWLDDPQAFRSRWGGTRPKVEETRAGIEAYVLQKVRTLMHRRFDRTAQAQQPCAAPTP